VGTEALLAALPVPAGAPLAEVFPVAVVFDLASKGLARGVRGTRGATRSGGRIGRAGSGARGVQESDAYRVHEIATRTLPRNITAPEGGCECGIGIVRALGIDIQRVATGIGLGAIRESLGIASDTRESLVVGGARSARALRIRISIMVATAWARAGLRAIVTIGSAQFDRLELAPGFDTARG
jgi:hypothetical protein